MSLSKLSVKEIRYILKQFPSEELHNVLKEHLYDCYIIVLFYLPDAKTRKKYRRMNNIISDHQFITLYWYFENPQLFPYPHQFMIKRLAKHFVIQWFQILVELEQSIWIKESYQIVIDTLKYHRHIRFMVVHNSYLLLENRKFPIYYRYLNIFL